MAETNTTKCASLMKISVAVVLLFSFLIESPLRSLIWIYFPSIAFFVAKTVVYFALLVALLLVVKPYVNVSNFFKALLAAVCLLAGDTVGDLISFTEITETVYAVLRPMAFLAILWFAFKWITKAELTFAKPFRRQTIISLAIYAVFRLGAYVHFAFRMRLSQADGWMDYLNMLSLSDSMFYKLAHLCFYIPILISLWQMLKLLPPKPVIEKSTAQEEMPTVIPEGSWQCIGCGMSVPEGVDECECGYKRQ